MSPLAMTLLILLVVFVALLSGKFGYGVVGGGVIVALILLNILTPAEALSGLANTNVVIMFAMTIISAGLMKTRLIEHAIGLVNKIGKTEAALIAGFGLIAGFMAQFMNAFLAVACLLPDQRHLQGAEDTQDEGHLSGYDHRADLYLLAAHRPGRGDLRADERLSGELWQRVHLRNF